MWQGLQAAIDSLFVGPVWPASVLVLIVVGYLVVSLIGMVDFEGPEISVEPEGWQSFGAGTLRWFHLGPIPIVLWMGCFAIFNWLIAYGLWTYFESDDYLPTLTESTILATRNAVIAAFVTKLVTGPLVPYLGDAVSFNEETMVGERCIVSSGEATATFGQAKYSTGGAPLLLNIRTDGVHLAKGDAALIVAYDTERRIYTVTAASTSPAATSNEMQP